jgi:Actin cytoskeleton-regulatory complex protein END3
LKRPSSWFARLTQQIWHLVDIRFEQAINQTQFVYLMHVVNQRRRGTPIPTGLPLSVKEEFMKEVFTFNLGVFN